MTNFSNIIYLIADFFLQNNFFKEVKKILKNKKKIIVFDIGCYRGYYTNQLLNLFNKKIYRAYLFDINSDVKKYIFNKFKLKKNIFFYNIGLINKIGFSYFYLNTLFDSAGTSFSKLVMKDKKWVNSRSNFLKIFYRKKIKFVKKKIETSTLDFFIKKNKINYIDILKVDIEGSEETFLQGAKSTLSSNKVKIIVLEIIGKKKSFLKKENRILKLLSKMNFCLLKKKKIISIGIFSNIIGADYLFVSNN